MHEKEKRFAYHLIPLHLRGTVLYPLHQLTVIYPDIAAKHMTKYQGRRHLLNKPIPPLDCLWNDVLMLSPVHPAAMKAAMEEPDTFAWHVNGLQSMQPVQARQYRDLLVWHASLRGADSPLQATLSGTVHAGSGGTEAVLPAGRAGQAGLALGESVTISSRVASM
jgi:hypothetical protein